ncbi:WXG100 family type VII secretion target [Nocardia sp. NBC_01503]|uniref:WXG100 family type VII secretion target n=1 Tax=Nocardia sp. NBC_01503 TaxID=2975997 RepID=UPI002E7AB90A|nr:WXG100 family type VII secretion target [Nocardia sp. NBC_01503]WTL33911.1 WXG100 family type VII secretion target [Nocardia sp. NBC_01503]
MSKRFIEHTEEGNIMSGNSVQSEHDVASKAQGHMADVVASVKAILAKVTASVDSSRSGFKGVAAVAFNQAADAWDGENKRLNDILNSIEQQVGTGVASFRHLDAENEAGFKTLTNL